MRVCSVPSPLRQGSEKGRGGGGNESKYTYSRKPDEGDVSCKIFTLLLFPFFCSSLSPLGFLRKEGVGWQFAINSGTSVLKYSVINVRRQCLISIHISNSSGMEKKKKHR